MLTKSQKERVIELRNEGWTLKKLSKKFHLTISQIMQILIKHKA